MNWRDAETVRRFVEAMNREQAKGLDTPAAIETARQEVENCGKVDRERRPGSFNARNDAAGFESPPFPTPSVNREEPEPCPCAPI